MKKRKLMLEPPLTPVTEQFYREAMTCGFTPVQAGFLLWWFDMSVLNKRADQMQEESDQRAMYEFDCREAGIEPQPWDLVTKFEREMGK